MVELVMILGNKIIETFQIVLSAEEIVSTFTKITYDKILAQMDPLLSY